LAPKLADQSVVSSGDQFQSGTLKEKALANEKAEAALQKVQNELSEYRVRCCKLKERVDHIERLNREHE